MKYGGSIVQPIVRLLIVMLSTTMAMIFGTTEA